MKKFYQFCFKGLAVAALAMMANVAVGQNLKVTSKGNPVANGDVIELTYVTEEMDYPDLGFYFCTFTWDPHLEVSTTAGSAQATVTVTSLENTSGFQLCWPDGCKSVNAGGSTSSSSTINATPQDLKIHKEVTIEEKGVLPTEGGSVKVKVVSGSETVEVTVKALLSGSNAVGENIADINAIPEYYTIQGIRVAEPQKGQLVIERKGSKVTKRIF